LIDRLNAVRFTVENVTVRWHNFNKGASSITIKKMLNVIIEKVARTARIGYDD